jgi:hypothetical protein
MPKGEPWYPNCMRCVLKHSMGIENHLDEAITRNAREGKNPMKYARVLAAQVEVRKMMEEIYYSDETMVSIHVGFDVSMDEVREAIEKVKKK